MLRLNHLVFPKSPGRLLQGRLVHLLEENAALDVSKGQEENEVSDALDTDVMLPSGPLQALGVEPGLGGVGRSCVLGASKA